MNRYSRWLQRLGSYDSQAAISVAGDSFSYRQLLDEIERWSSRLRDHGFVPGHIVAARCEYSLAAISAMLSVLANRGVFALIPGGGNSDRFIAESRAQILLNAHSDGSHEVVAGLHPPLRNPVLDRLNQESCGGFIVFTSGSTGVPKAAVHSIERFIARFEKPGRRFRTLTFSTMDHIAGLDTLFYTLTSGGTLVLTHSRLPSNIIKIIELESVEVLPTSPSFLRMLCASEDLEKADLSRLKIITYGSEPMDQHTLAQVNRLFPGIEILQKYGSTELGAPKTTSRGKDSLWIKFRDSNIETKIIDGILWVRSSSSTLGYLNAPLELDRAGWYCTGDRVETRDGWIRFLGREGECINVGGQKCYPAEVEEVIRELDFVRDVLVFGEPHPLLGQVVAAQVAAPDADANMDARQQVRLHCRQRLSLFKVPMKISIVDRIAVTDRQKRTRTELTSL